MERRNYLLNQCLIYSDFTKHFFKFKACTTYLEKQMIVQKFLKKHSFKETDLINFHHELLEVAQKCLGEFLYLCNNCDQTRISNLYFVEVENSTSESSEYVLQRKLEGCYLTLKNSLLKILKEAGMLI